MDRAKTLTAAGEERDEQSVNSPLELWQAIDLTLKNQVGNVLSVDDPREFAVRLNEFARAVADNFFPSTIIDVTPAPAKEDAN